jgi:His/Glu/Gln/Arg/opine family amino acid ABC transporter permease subunit
MTVDLSPIVGAWPFLAKALGVTVFVSLASMFLGFVLGLLVGAGRVYGGRALDLILGFYVDTMRAVPVLVVLVWTYFSFPLLIGRSLNAVTAGVAALALHLAAYVAEVIRAGLTSVRPGQMRAALALGMSPTQAVRSIILPQALIRMLPALGSLLVIAIKDSAIASVIAVPELMRQSQILAGQTFRPFEIYTCAMLVYFALCYPIARGIDRLYRRVAHLGSS